MIRAEYRKVHLLLYTEERRYLERIETESKEIFQQLRESKDSMYLKGTYLRVVYEELKEMCHRPDMELLQVRPKEWRVTQRAAGKVSIFFPLHSNVSLG